MAWEYYCYDLVDMCKMDAVKGDIVWVMENNGRYMYNGGSWTKIGEAPKMGNRKEGDCATCGNRGKYEWCNSVLDALDAPCSYYKDKRTKSVPYFNEPPYYIDPCSFNNLGTALTAAWINADTNVWLNGRHIDGNPHAGDILTVRGYKWKVFAVEYPDDTGYERYLLQRMDDDNG